MINPHRIERESGTDLIKAETRGLTGPDAVNALHLFLLKEWSAFDELTKKARVRRIRLGHLLLGLQHLIDSGENGDLCNFWEWFDDMVPGRSRSDARDMMHTAGQADPDAAYDRKLEKQKEYTERHYRKKFGLPFSTPTLPAPEPEAERSFKNTDQTPAEPEFFRPTRKPTKQFPSAEDDDSIIEQIINLFRRLSWNGCVRAIKRIGEEYKSRQAGKR